MTKYRLKNIDCAVCAQGLEDGIRKVDGVESVSVDFGTLSMRIEARDLGLVETAARAIEPALVLERIAAGVRPVAAAEPSYDLRRELVFFALAAAFATIGMILGPAGAFAESGARRFGGSFPATARLVALLAAYALAGWNVVAGAARNILRGRVFDELFLMGIATLGAFAIGQYEEAVGVMVFYKIGEMLQESATARSRASVRSLLALRPDFARVRRSGAWVEISPEEAIAGDEFMVMPGERLPLDGEVIEGEAFMDCSALTGESLPRRAWPGSEVLAGTISTDGSLVARATRPAGESSAARIVELVENAAHAKARTELFITRFAAVYTPVVVILAAAVAFLPPLLVPGQSLRDWAYRALVMLVISCPCALVVSVPLGYFGGIGGAARRGILIKGAQVLDALAAAKTVVFDKTGTLTKGKFRLLGISCEPGWSENAILALAAASESRSRHPIAASVRVEAAARGLSVGTEDEASDILEVAGAGVVATVGGRRIVAGNDRLLHLEGVPHDSCDPDGTTVNVAVAGRYVGRLLIGDEPRADAAAAMHALRELGIGRTVMLTGDAACSAAPVAAALGIREVHAGLLPEGKLELLERIIGETRAAGGGTVFVGDGVNDAPVLARADVGIAMGAGSDAAVECADVVLMTDEPSRVAEAIDRARRTRRIVTQNIVFALGVKAGFLALGAMGIAVMWEAVIADVGVALLAVANSLRAMR